MSTLIAIVTCARYKNRVQAQLDTWIPALRDKGYPVEIFDGARLGVPDDYRNMPTKLRAILEWTLRNGYSHLCKIDDDGAINPQTFTTVRESYAGIRQRANDYGNCSLGFPTYPIGTFPHDYASGGAFWLDHTAMATILSEPFPIDDFADDRLVGHVLANQGIEFTELHGYGIGTPGKDWIVATQLYPKAMYELYKAAQ